MNSNENRREPWGGSLEFMLIAAAREVAAFQRVFVGFHWPILVAEVALRLHAPTMVRVFEAGALVDGPWDLVPTSTTEFNRFNGCSSYHGDTLWALYSALRHRRIQASLLGASNVDRYGNLNSTVLGPYQQPLVRLAGAGGATEVAAFSERLYIIAGSADPRRYASRLDFVTAPGYLWGGNSREAAGYPPGSGPTALFTPFGVFRFDNADRVAQLDTVYPGVSYERFLQHLQWPVRPGGPRLLEDMSELEKATVRAVLEEARARGYHI